MDIPYDGFETHQQALRSRSKEIRVGPGETQDLCVSLACEHFSFLSGKDRNYA